MESEEIVSNIGIDTFPTNHKFPLGAQTVDSVSELTNITSSLTEEPHNNDCKISIQVLRILWAKLMVGIDFTIAILPKNISYV